MATNEERSRIDKLLAGETGSTMKSAAGSFEQGELDRIAKLMSRIGMHNRSEFIRAMVMDGVETMEDKIPAIEAARKAKADARDKAAAEAEAIKKKSAEEKAKKKAEADKKGK